MRSKTSCFNRAFSRHLLRRFWPLWLLWLAALLVVAIGAPLGNPPEAYGSHMAYLNELNRTMLETGVFLAKAAAAAGPLMAMAMLGYLYNPRSCGMVCSLPMRREETYFTAVLTGLIPMLLADVLVFLLLLVRFGGMEGVHREYIVKWLELVVLGNAGFYGFACFCGLLTGSTVILPVVYVLLGCAAVVYESGVRAVLRMLVYGYTWDRIYISFLSPLPTILSDLHVNGLRAPGWTEELAARGETEMIYQVKGMDYLVGFCIAGIALAVVAVLILKKRQMENAGDIVAVPVLRPLFRICMAVGTALVAASIVCDEFFSQVLSGRTLFAAVLATLILGAALGYFIAEMLIKKTLRVFGRGWKQLGLICAALILFAVLAKADVAGYETRLPEADAIEAVIVPHNGDRFTDPDFIAAFRDFHAGLIAHRAENENTLSPRSMTISLNYELKNGKTFSRLYHIAVNEAAEQDPDSDLNRYENLMNRPEAILRRVGADRDIGEDTILYANLDIYSPNPVPNRGMQSETLRLTVDQAASLYREGILPDAEAGNIERWYAWESEACRSEPMNVCVNLGLTPRPGITADPVPTAVPLAVATYDPYQHLSITVLNRSENTLRWLKENLDLEPQSTAALRQGEG